MEKNSLLPPLQHDKKKRGKAGKDVTKYVELKKQILQYYPQIQNLEKNVISLKQQIPLNLSKVILELKQETQRLLESSNPSITDTNNSIAQKELSELEKRLKQRIQESLRKNKADVQARMKTIAENSELKDQIKERSEIRIKSRLSSLEHLIDQKYKMFNSNVSIIENNLSKLTFKSHPSIQHNYLSQIHTQNDLNKTQITLIISQLDELDDLIKRRDKEQNETQEKIDAKFGTIDSKTGRIINKPIDYTDDFEELQRKIYDFNRDFMLKIEEVDRKSEIIEQHTNEIEQMASDLLDATQEIAAHSTETEGLVRDLIQSVDKITKEMDNNITKASINQLSIQIQASQDSIRSTIDKLNQKLHHFDITFPFQS